MCRNKLGMSWREIGECNIRAAEAAFIDDPNEKQALIDIVSHRVNLWIEKQEKSDIERRKRQNIKDQNFKAALIGFAFVASSYFVSKNLKL